MEEEEKKAIEQMKLEFDVDKNLFDLDDLDF